MTNLFNKEDVISWVNCSEVKIGEHGYFGFNRQDLEYRIKRENPKILSEINEDSANAFKAEGAWYPFFLPIYRVNEQLYRPLSTVDELLDFLIPDFDFNAICDKAGNKIEIDACKKAEILLGKKITLRQKEADWIKVMTITEVDFSDDSDDSSNMYINGMSLDNLFYNYEIQINGVFVPFGVKWDMEE